MKNYLLPVELRKELRKPWGLPLFGKKEEIAQNFERLLKEKKFKKVITVGDYCSLSLPSDIKIFDGKIKKRKIKKTLKFSLSCNNPAGTIHGEVWPKIKKAIKNNENLFVDGEEDLLVIPCVLLSEKDTAVVYGLFKKGVCLIDVSPKVKKIFKELLKNFQVK